MSLHDTRLTTYNQSNWVGLANYRNLFTHQFFWHALENTVTIGIISTVPQLMIALGIAHLLNYRLRGRTFFRVALLMPYATSLAAATVIFIELFSGDYGLINIVLHTVLHLPKVDWQGSKWPSQIAVSTIVTWRWTGYNALIYLAGMQAIDGSLYEAAAIDGASRWQQFRFVTLPGSAADDPVHDRRLDDRCGATVRRAVAVFADRPAQRRLVGLLPDPRRADVPAGLDERPARAGLGDRLDDVRDHRAGGAGQHDPRPPPRAPRGAATDPLRLRGERAATRRRPMTATIDRVSVGRVRPAPRRRRAPQADGRGTGRLRGRFARHADVGVPAVLHDRHGLAHELGDGQEGAAVPAERQPVLQYPSGP